jgi:hypothetical protein
MARMDIRAAILLLFTLCLALGLLAFVNFPGIAKGFRVDTAVLQNPRLDEQIWPSQ